MMIFIICKILCLKFIIYFLNVMAFHGFCDLGLHIVLCHRIISVFPEMGFTGKTLFQKILLVAITTMGAGKLKFSSSHW